MKEFMTLIKDYGIMPVVETLGWLVAVGFAMTLIPSLNFIPKMFMLYILTPYVFGH